MSSKLEELITNISNNARSVDITKKESIERFIESTDEHLTQLCQLMSGV